jgi:hypothetical protein
MSSVFCKLDRLLQVFTLSWEIIWAAFFKTQDYGPIINERVCNFDQFQPTVMEYSAGLQRIANPNPV